MKRINSSADTPERESMTKNKNSSSPFSILKLDIFPRILTEAGEILHEQWKRNPLPIQLFLLLCLNLLIAPAVDAATGQEITRKAAYGLGILGMVTVGLAIYLFAVILQPERF